jgi:hypothetical protein
MAEPQVDSLGRVGRDLESLQQPPPAANGPAAAKAGKKPLHPAAADPTLAAGGDGWW